MLKKLLFAVLGTGWGLLFFWLGLVLTFPKEETAERVKYEVANATDNAMLLEMEGLGPWRATGAKADVVELYATPRRGDPERLLRADHVAARLQLLPLVTGALSAGVDADLYDGELSGSVGQKGEVLNIDLLASDLDLSRYPFAYEGFSSDIGGRLRLRTTLAWDKEDPAKSAGLVRLEITDLTMNETSVGGFFTLPATTFTESILSFDIEDGKAKVKKGRFIGDLVEMEVDGDITLRNPFGRSTMNLTVDFTLADELDNMAKLVPDLKRARDDDGVYHYRVTGTVERRRFTPVRQGSASRNRATPTRDRTVDRTVDRDEDPDAMEERRRARQDRIRERRERLNADRDRPERPDARDPDDRDDRDFDDRDDRDFDEDFDDGPLDEFDDRDFDDFDDGPLRDDDMPGGMDDFDDLPPPGGIPDDLPPIDDPPFDD